MGFKYFLMAKIDWTHRSLNCDADVKSPTSEFSES